MAALSLACCSPGSDVIAAWKSAEWCWANCLISMAEVVWVSVKRRQKTSGRMTEKIDDQQKSSVQGRTGEAE